MTRRFPIFATLVVVAAVAIMIGLGIWQLERAEWKDRLVDQYRDAANREPISFPTAPRTGEPPLFRWATGYCLRPVSHRARAGSNRQGEPGYVHIVDCTTGAEGPGMAVELGWSKDPQAKWQWQGGPVTGIIAPDPERRMRLVAASAPQGLEASALPSVEAIPRNHRMYAFTWFSFAFIALLIYFLALRKRWRGE
ncbi:MAG TPA: SURF1 family protein [Sphingomicrobium sp.]|nr:SURF1 family protein [Sphingomicrobium sp.]